MDELKTEVTYYDPNDAPKEYVPIPKGKYMAHVSEFGISNNGWLSNDNQLAVIYEAKYKLSEKYLEDKVLRNDQGSEFAGSEFAGREVRSKGIFLFKKPGPSETFKANPAGNKRMFIFLEAVNYPLNSVTVKNDKGQEINVKEIPVDIDDTKIIGQPILIEIGHELYKEKTYEKEFQVFKPLDGYEPIKQEEEDDDIPF